jgi:transposase-like protein
VSIITSRRRRQNWSAHDKAQIIAESHESDANISEVARRNGASHLAALSEKARDYARAARSQNTQRAYDAAWRQFAAWLRRQGS